MALLTILEYPDPRLRKVAKPVEQVDQYIQQIISDMLETMYDAQGVGLAAIQVDVGKRIIVMDLSETRDKPQVLINPTFKPINSEKSELKEGCLSVPGIYETLDRHNNISLTALDAKGNLYTKECTGLEAVCVQHEIDHLDGKLFIDTLSELKRSRINKKLYKSRRLQK